MTLSKHFYAISTQTTLDINTGTYRSMRPVRGGKTAPCVAGCPVGQDVRGFIQLIAQGDFDRALGLLLEANPMPGVTGRVCHQPCEAVCNRASLDEALTIQALERAAASYGKAALEAPQPKAKSVAVVGSGPAGLSCAFHLRRAGWRVTVFERDRLLGGLMRTAIPPYRLPRNVLDADLGRLVELGVEFSAGVAVGEEVSLEELRGSFDAVFLALGAQSSRALEMPGLGDAPLTRGLEFLKALNGHRPPPSPGRVAVLGGGNTAFDVARTVKRLGGEPIICSPEDLDSMPAFAKEVALARAEDVTILAGVGFGEIEPGAILIEIEGRTRRLEVDRVIVAVGEEVETGWLPSTLVDNGTVSVDGASATPWEGVFAGGDCTAGERTVAHALGEGRLAARSIDAYLCGGPAPALEPPSEAARIEDINADYLEPGPAAAIVPEAPVAERLGSLDAEVVGDLSRPVAEREASRCLSCGWCTVCGNCLIFCPDLAVVREDDGSGVRVLYEYCKGCGICATECPSGALILVREGMRE